MDNIPIGGRDEIEEDRQDDDNDEEEEEANRNDVVDVYAWDPEVHNFRQQLRKHVLFMLKISGTDKIKQAPPPPTAREISTFNSCTSPFNTAVQSVFADDFHQKVLEEKWYHYLDILERFMDQD
ncbi:hypothetical protein ID866_11040 [Astraeus odoratus]|nr:hypothetical protein ID866_11040 [Astraeus odoratus]